MGVKKQNWEELVVQVQQASERKGIYQETLAEQSGLKQSNISRIFKRQYCPTLRTTLALANAAGLTLKLSEDENN